jgi:hypothetical protein
VGSVKGGLETLEEEGRVDPALSSGSAATIALLLGFVEVTSLTAIAPPRLQNRFFLIRPPIDKPAARMLSAASVPAQCLEGQLAKGNRTDSMSGRHNVDSGIGTDLVFGRTLQLIKRSKMVLQHTSNSSLRVKRTDAAVKTLSSQRTHCLENSYGVPLARATAEGHRVPHLYPPLAGQDEPPTACRDGEPKGAPSSGSPDPPSMHVNHAVRGREGVRETCRITHHFRAVQQKVLYRPFASSDTVCSL